MQEASKTQLGVEIVREGMVKLMSPENFWTNMGHLQLFLSLLQPRFRDRGKESKGGVRKSDFKQALGPLLTGCITLG